MHEKEKDKEKDKDKEKENGNNRNTPTRRFSGSTVASAVRADGLIVTVTLRELISQELLEKKQELPQIWQLAVTEGGIPVTDLTGNPVTVRFPFEAPEVWGDPAKIPEGSLYAVFADEDGKLTAYSAQYNPETGEIWFDAEKTGDFVIVRFDYEKEPFTEDFYRALAELKEIREFLVALAEEQRP